MGYSPWGPKEPDTTEQLTLRKTHQAQNPLRSESVETNHCLLLSDVSGQSLRGRVGDDPCNSEFSSSIDCLNCVCLSGFSSTVGFCSLLRLVLRLLQCAWLPFRTAGFGAGWGSLLQCEEVPLDGHIQALPSSGVD